MDVRTLIATAYATAKEAKGATKDVIGKAVPTPACSHACAVWVSTSLPHTAPTHSPRTAPEPPSPVSIICSRCSLSHSIEQPCRGPSHRMGLKRPTCSTNDKHIAQTDCNRIAMEK